METGINAWLANQEFDPSGNDIRVDLPGGWFWNMSPNKTGHLVDPKGQLCVGYDLNYNIIQFGNDGETKAPGLNLWTIQEMGEKFAREHFMDDQTAIDYDQFANERNSNRREYEKKVREEMTGLIQIELKDSKWTAHANVDAIKAMTGIDTEPELTREQGIALFNKMSEARHVMPLRDPMGYMGLENNLYDYIKDQYEFQYDDAIQNIEAGFITGNGHGCEAVLAKLDKTVRHDIRINCLPEFVNYRDLRHMDPTPELQSAVNDFVKQRVIVTIDYERKRNYSKEAIEKDFNKYTAAGEALKEQISEAAFPMDMSFDDDNNVKIEV